MVMDKGNDAVEVSPHMKLHSFLSHQDWICCFQGFYSKLIDETAYTESMLESNIPVYSKWQLRTEMKKILVLIIMD